MTEDGHPQRTGSAPGDVVERRDVPPVRVALLLAGLLGALVPICAAVAGLLILFDRVAPPEASPPPAALAPPEPRLQVDDSIQRRRLEADAQRAVQGGEGRRDLDAAMGRLVTKGWGTPEEPPR